MRPNGRSNSVSSISSQSSISSLPSVSDDSIQIFVKNLAGNTFAITLPPTTTISHLTTLLSLRTPTTHLSSPPRLVFAGKHLSDSTATLQDYHIRSDATLHLALPILGGMATRKGPICEFRVGKDNACKSVAQRIVGDCGFCNGHFCSKHRQLESHNCTGLEDCKKESHERNADKLISERTVAIKGI